MQTKGQKNNGGPAPQPLPQREGSIINSVGSQLQKVTTPRPLREGQAGRSVGAVSQRCPNCGTVNDVSATFCENCGTALHETTCPYCGVTVAPEADYCENCHKYISPDRCSFCGAPMSQADEFCQECGSPRRGITCPTCHSLSRFGFCEHCGTPLTDRAQLELKKAWDVECAEQVRTLEREIEELWRTKPVTSKQERARRERNEELRERVLRLLRENEDPFFADFPASCEPKTAPTSDELQNAIEQKRKALQALLDSMATEPTLNPAVARNQAMARKPHISRLAWRCNWRQALHSSPLACACPQHGGQWIVLNGRENQELT